MPSELFDTPGVHQFDPTGLGDITFIIRGAGGNGGNGDDAAGGAGGGGGGVAVGVIPAAHLVGATGLAIEVPGGGSEDNARISIEGGPNNSMGVMVVPGENASGTVAGAGGYMDDDQLSWVTASYSGGDGAANPGDIGGGGGGSAGSAGNGGDGDGAIGGDGGTPDGHQGGNGGAFGVSGSAGTGIGAGGGGGGAYMNGGGGGDGEIYLEWETGGTSTPNITALIAILNNMKRQRR